MILNLDEFIERERPYWEELEKKLETLEVRAEESMDLEELKRFHYLYRRASSDLAQLNNFISEPEIKDYLENLVSRAYTKVHRRKTKKEGFSPTRWFFTTFPQTFRRHASAFLLVLGVVVVGMLFGGGAIALDADAKDIIMPFGHLKIDPSERVQQEETMSSDQNLEGAKGRFSAKLMTHNIRVSILALALGLTWGLGTIIVLFYNGVILGAVAIDYVLAGETTFLLGWLLPHGIVEIPAFMLAGQAGFLLAGALIGWGDRNSVTDRFRAVAGDAVTLISGAAIFLVWAGIIESFFSQYHAPLLPYGVKIGFGVFEFILLVLFFWFAGKNDMDGRSDE